MPSHVQHHLQNFEAVLKNVQSYYVFQLIWPSLSAKLLLSGNALASLGCGNLPQSSFTLVPGSESPAVYNQREE
jgi:hypothetical protein